MTDSNVPIDPDLGEPDENQTPVGGGEESTPDPDVPGLGDSPYETPKPSTSPDGDDLGLADPNIGGTLGTDPGYGSV